MVIADLRNPSRFPDPCNQVGEPRIGRPSEHVVCIPEERAAADFVSSPRGECVLHDGRNQAAASRVERLPVHRYGLWYLRVRGSSSGPGDPRRATRGARALGACRHDAAAAGVRSRIVLLAATGTPSKHIAAQLDTSQDTTYGVAAPVRDRRAGGDFRGVPDLIDAITGHRSKRQGRQAPAQCGSLAETLLFKPGL